MAPIFSFGTRGFWLWGCVRPHSSTSSFPPPAPLASCVIQPPSRRFPAERRRLLCQWQRLLQQRHRPQRNERLPRLRGEAPRPSSASSEPAACPSHSHTTTPAGPRWRPQLTPPPALLVPSLPFPSCAGRNLRQRPSGGLRHPRRRRDARGLRQRRRDQRRGQREHHKGRLRKLRDWELRLCVRPGPIPTRLQQWLMRVRHPHTPSPRLAIAQTAGAYISPTRASSRT